MNEIQRRNKQLKFINKNKQTSNNFFKIFRNHQEWSQIFENNNIKNNLL